MARDTKEKKIIVKKPAAKTATKKVATAKAPLKKMAVKKAAVKKPAVKKAVEKKAVEKKAVAKTSKAKTGKATAAIELGLPEQLRDATLKILDERQAEEIVVVPLAGRSSVADYMILATGRAGRQIAAISDYLREAYFKLGVRGVRVEGKSEANWVLIDAGDIIVHLFRPEVRSYYDLDRIWDGRTKK